MKLTPLFMTLGSLALGTSSSFALSPDAFSLSFEYSYEDSDPLKEKKEKTIKLLDEAIKFYKKHGFEKSLKVFQNQDGPFCQKKKYGYFGINLYTPEGYLLAACKVPGLVGKNLLGWEGPGNVLVIKEFIEKTKKNPEGSFIPRVTSYSPFTGNPSAAEFYSKIVDNIIFAADVYYTVPLHKKLEVIEDLPSALNPKNATPLNKNQME